MNLLISLRSELLKTRRTAAFYLALFLAAIVPIIFLLDWGFDGIPAESRKDPFNALFRESMGFLSILILPMFVVLVCTLLPQIEYRNGTWKQVFASPQKMEHIFFARFLHIQLMILLFLTAYNLYLFLVAVAIHFLDPGPRLLHQPLDGAAVLAGTAKMYIAVLAISAFQFWAGLRFRNFILPIAIGFGMWLCASLMVMEFHVPAAHYFPFSFLIYSLFPKFEPLMPSVRALSLGYTVLFLILGYLDFRRKKLRA